WVVDKLDEMTMGDLVEQFVTQFYGAESEGAASSGIPREVLVPVLPDDADALSEWLCDRRGSRVQLRVPQRGDKKALQETVARNAAQSLSQHKLKRASDLTARSLALGELQDALTLDVAPLRIECFDVSHVQGTNVVASMVVFEDGLARKSEYRRFAMREGTGDTDWIAEVVRRRFARYLDEQVAEGADADSDPAAEAAEERPGIDPATGRARKFAYPPNLLVVDGGAPQVAAAQAVLDDLGIDDVALVGLAKRLEEVWRPGEAHPTILPRASEGLYLLQRVRDEAHRFAITFHREKRSKAMTVSALDGIAGLGETRRKALLRHFGSVRKLRAADVEELAQVKGIGPSTAEAIAASFAKESAPTPAVNVSTGEILDPDAERVMEVSGEDVSDAAEGST
ncbi:MAG: excinuclease ABC subunit UvrC, partial [Pseudonocardiales bacterium]